MPVLPVVYHDDYLKYDFGPEHPFTPVRWQALHDLLSRSDLPIEWIEAVAATEEQLLRVHSDDFVSAVQSASEAVTFRSPGIYGLGTGDVPTFLGMHEAAAMVAGGSLTAGKLVVEGGYRRALQLSGGLHHAMFNYAAGFCVYNDLAVLIQELRSEGLRVAYIDIDVHHGDGVQAIYYDDPDVLTVSLHESGLYLFPGTGFFNELGTDGAFGTSLNVPLYPGTTDESWLKSFDAIVPGAVSDFSPDILVVQCGADGHRLDPLAHLSLTTRAYASIFDRLIQLAEDTTKGRLVALLGGGYAFDSTLRIWSMLAYKLAGEQLPEELPSDWCRDWQHELDHPEWKKWHDETLETGDDERAVSVAKTNRETVEALSRALAVAH